MLENILLLLNYSLLLYFGLFVSAAFINIEFNKRNIIILLVFGIIINLVQGMCYIKLGFETIVWLYPIITHIPIVLLYCICFKRKLSLSIIAVMSAYLCCQLSNWFYILVLYFTQEKWVAHGTRSIISLILGFLIIRYLAPSIAAILNKPLNTIFIFIILPVSYYFFDNIVRRYTNILSIGSDAVFEFLPFVLSVAYLTFNVAYFKEYEKKCEVERHNQLIEMQQSHTKKEIEAIRRSEYTVSLLRHDMRHFLSNIFSYIECGNTEKAKAYIFEIIASTDETAPQKYCDNEIVNMILCSYENQIREKEIRFHHNVRIPSELPVSDVDFTSILSNGLENAIKAVSALDSDKRTITLDLYKKDDKLLLSIENPYNNEIEMINGLPQSNEIGHGLGTHSIKFVTEKSKGNCQFVAINGQFTLKVIL